MIDAQILNKLRIISTEEQRILSGDSEIQRELYMHDGSSQIDAGKLLSAGKLMDIRPHTRFVHFPEHTHNYVEMVYMCMGSTTHIVNGNTITLREGELLFFGQGVRQEILPAGENDIAVNFIILPQFFDKALEMLGEEESPLRRFVVDCLGSATGSSNYLYFQVADVLPIQNMIENLLWTLDRSLPNRRSICQSTMGVLFMQLMNHTERLAYERTEDAAVMSVLRYIEDHYPTGTLTEIADFLHYDFCWLSREIKRKTGRTFKELLQDKRLTQAAYLLKATTLHVDEIADAVGYSNKSYFHRIFQEKYGLSPKKYRDRGE